MASATQEPPAASGVDAPAARVLSSRARAGRSRRQDFRGDLAITVDRGAWVEAATLLRDHPELDFKLFLDLCGVDYLDDDADDYDRYEVALHLYSVTHGHHVRLKTTAPEKGASVPTLTRVYKGANWFEREAWDLYGIEFAGHPNLTRILTHDDVRRATRCGRTTRPAQRHVLKSPKARLLEVPARLRAAASSTSARRIRPCTARSACRR